VRLTFKNNASQGSKMQHSWVLSRPNTETQVAAAAASAGSEKQYIPKTPDILANTRLLNPGESQTINFQSPSSPGKYPFICTFPGHSISMKGTLEVK
jgi:azurin